MSDDDIEKFLDAIELAFSNMDERTFWPASGAQICSYFDDIEALDVYSKVRIIEEKDLDLRKIANLFRTPSTIRYFLILGGITGLKVAKKFKIVNITTQDIIDYVKFFFSILRIKQVGDIFCLDGTNRVLSDSDIQKVVENIEWKEVLDDESRKKIAYFSIDLTSFVWSIFFDIYVAAGMETHGPYLINIFGRNFILLIREFFNLRPVEIWSHLEGFKYDSFKLYCVYENTNLNDITIDFANHVIFREPLISKLKYFCIVSSSEGREEFINLDETKNIGETISYITQKQVKLVNSLDPLSIIKKGSEISYFMFKDFREYFGESWKPPKEVELRIKKIGLRRWNRFKPRRKKSSEYYRKLFDPRNDFIG